MVLRIRSVFAYDWLSKVGQRSNVVFSTSIFFGSKRCELWLRSGVGGVQVEAERAERSE